MTKNQSVLVDTDVFSYLLRGGEAAERYRPHVQSHRCCLSFMTVAELLKGAILRKWGKRRLEALQQTISQYVVLPYDLATAEAWAAIAAHRQQEGHPIACADCWIAAAAVRHGIPLVTNNRKDFEGIPGLKVISEASA